MTRERLSVSIGQEIPQIILPNEVKHTFSEGFLHICYRIISITNDTTKPTGAEINQNNFSILGLINETKCLKLHSFYGAKEHKLFRYSSLKIMLWDAFHPSV